MEYFFNHIVYILIGAMLIAAIATIWAVVSIRHGKETDNDDADMCGLGCSGCTMLTDCRKPEKEAFGKDEK